MIIPFKKMAKLLCIPELTLKRWIKQGKIPAYEHNNEYYFIKKEIEKWAWEHNIFLHKNINEVKKHSEDENVSLTEAFKKGGVFYNIEVDNAIDLLKKITELAPLPEKVDRQMLFDLLLQREKIASTGIGNGVAIPHPRYPLTNLISQGQISSFLLKNPIDYNSVDQKKIFVAFLMLSPSTKSHLKYLSKLSISLRDPEFMNLLKNNASEEKILEKLFEIESKTK